MERSQFFAWSFGVGLDVSDLLKRASVRKECLANYGMTRISRSGMGTAAERFSNASLPHYAGSLEQYRQARPGDAGDSSVGKAG